MLNFNKAFFFVSVFLFVSATALAQRDSTRTKLPRPIKCLVIEPTVRIGKIIKNFPSFPDRGVAVLSEINITQQCSGNKKWHQFYGYPAAGIAFIYGIMGNDNVFGRNFSFLPNISFMPKKYRRWGFQYKIGMGFAFHTKKFDRITNPDNRLIGSTITNMALFSIDFRYDISNYYTLLMGVSGIHYSDGHFQIPNIGANFPTFNISLKYFPFGRPELFIHDTLPDYSRKILFNIRLGMGMHEFGDAIKPTNGPKYPIYNGSLYLTKRCSRKNNVHFGIHINYHTMFYDYIVQQDVYDSHQRMKAFTGLIFLGHEFIMGHFGLVTQLGFYFYNPFYKKLQELKQSPANFDNWIKRYNSNKIGVQYYFMDPMKTTKNKIFIGLYLKANFGQADFAELSAGCAF